MLAFLTALSMLPAAAKDLPVLTPKLGPVQDVSAENIERWNQNFAAMNAGKELAVEDFADGFDETMDGPWSTITAACSWYCGGELYKQTSSSTLPKSSKSAYDAGNLHDSDIRTAWVEGKDGEGIGESVSFFFKPKSPRVNTISIWNGYQKSPEIYQKNSRPRKLKVHVNGTPSYILQLEDTRAVQAFTIAPVRSEKEGVDLEIRLEILEVYSGTKWKDTAISEINFDGLDVH
jgi:hypothetical protein